MLLCRLSSVTHINSPKLPPKLTDMLWIKGYSDEVSENLTTFVTEHIFVGYTIGERWSKQTK